MMQVLICPECGTENPLEEESCQKCAASLVEVTPVDRPEQENLTEDEINFVDETENDLPELLHALKQPDASDVSEDAIKDDDASPDSEAIFGPEEVVEDEDVPAWLQRIRERAQQEEDSVGEVTQKISAAKESIEESYSQDQREDFEAWIQQLRNQARQTPDHPQGSEALEVPSDEIPSWLLKIRKERHPSDELKDSPEGSEAEPAGKDLPQWLVPEEPIEVDQPSEDRKAEEETRQLEVAPAIIEDDETQEVDTSELDEIAIREPVITVSREEQASIDQLTAVIADEYATRTIAQPVKRSSIRVSRLILALLLIVSLSLSLFISNIPGMSQGQVQPHNLSLLTWADNLTTADTLLVVLDYQPGFSSEISTVAKPIIENSLSVVSEISILSSTPMGSLLFKQLVRELGLENDVLINDLGYFPIPEYGAYHLAMQSGASWRFTHLPQTEKVLPSDGYVGILILSDTFEGASAWVGQLSSLLSDIPIYLLVTAQAGPLLMPYVASGQVMGMISGITEVVGIENVMEQGAHFEQAWHTYQIGVLMLIALLVIGAIFSGGKKGHIERQKKA